MFAFCTCSWLFALLDGTGRCDLGRRSGNGNRDGHEVEISEQLAVARQVLAATSLQFRFGHCWQVNVCRSRRSVVVSWTESKRFITEVRCGQRAGNFLNFLSSGRIRESLCAHSSICQIFRHRRGSIRFTDRCLFVCKPSSTVSMSRSRLEKPVLGLSETTIACVCTLSA